MGDPLHRDSGARKQPKGHSMTKRVSVLMGGWSVEREVSLVSGRAVADALAASNYCINTIDVTRDISALLSALDPKPNRRNLARFREFCLRMKGNSVKRAFFQSCAVFLQESRVWYK